MRPIAGLCCVTVLAVVLVLPSPPVHAQLQTQGAATKLGRGLVNVFTGWVEIPKRIYETSRTDGAAAGWTWGLLCGVGRGFIRTAAGFYEFFTFPFPAPPGYAPIIEPEYIFTSEGANPPTEHTYR